MTHFWLNDSEIHTREPRGMPVLDFLRGRHKLNGTKEGCREGDCGACAVLIGELQGDKVSYRSVTSCLVPLGELHGKHLVTIEGLNLDGGLSAIQQAVVDEGATQCGFCTPGIIVSLTGHLMQVGADLSKTGVKEALGGHLCRCTGYRSLKAVSDHLAGNGASATGVDRLVDAGQLPAYFDGMPARLAAIPERTPASSAGGDGAADRFAIAGGTDIYVQRGDDIPDAEVDVLNLMPRMHGIDRQHKHLGVGATTTFEEFANHPDVVAIVPEIKAYMFLIASVQIRNRATLGGNVINASPIGDMTILLMALDARLVLASDGRRRTVPMTEFYLGYKEMDRLPGEVLEEILIPLPAAGSRINWEKVSKRKCLDIATVNSAASVVTDGTTIASARLAMGGVAPVPLYLRETSRYLAGKEISAATISGAMRIVQQEISPISDVRGSAEYRRLLARQLMIAHFDRMFPGSVGEEMIGGDV